jgi:hypothetical protein
VYEGEVTELTPEETENPLGGVHPCLLVLIWWKSGVRLLISVPPCARSTALTRPLQGTERLLAT